MKSPGGNDWSRRKSQFTHHWLKNGLLSALDAAANVMHGRATGRGYVQDVLDHEVQEWPARREELHLLLDAFDAEMSPSTLFDIEPMCNWEPDLRRVMRSVLHEAWMARSTMREALKRTSAAAERVDDAYHALIHSTDGTTEEASGLVRSLDVLRGACRDLCACLESLPQGVVLT